MPRCETQSRLGNAAESAKLTCRSTARESQRSPLPIRFPLCGMAFISCDFGRRDVCQNSPSWFAARARRRRVRLRWPTPLARHSALQACLQYEVSRHFGCLCPLDVNSGRLDQRHSSRPGPNQSRDRSTDFLSWPMPAWRGRRDSYCGRVFYSLTNAIRARNRGSRHAFRSPICGGWCVSADSCIRSTIQVVDLRERLPVWVRIIDEAARAIFHSVWLCLSFRP